MKRAIALFSCLALSGVAFAGDDAPEVETSVGIETHGDTYYVGEAMWIRVRIEYDWQYFKKHAIPLFLQALDVPLQVDAPCFREWKGAKAIDLSPNDVGPARRAVRIAMNGAATDAFDPTDLDSVRRGGEPDVLEVERTFVLTAPGELVVPAPTISYAFATSFRDDLINGRMPVDRRDVVVHGKSKLLHVLPLPEKDRPSAFQGAIGQWFTVATDVDRHAVDVGQTFHLTLRIEGDGNLATVPTPRLDGLEGFHIYGAIDDKHPRTRTVVYDVAALAADVRELPPIPFAYFQPGPPAEYRIVRTDRIPLDVRAVAGEANSLEPKAASTAGWLSGALVALLALIVLGMARRARSRAVVHPGAAVQASATALFRVRVARPNADVAAAFADVLAAHLDCEAPAVIAPDLATRLLARKWELSLATRTAAMMNRLVAVGYGAPGAATDVDDARGLVEEIDEKVRPAQSPR